MGVQAHVLVLDDDVSTLEFIADVLGDEGYRVTAASNCAQALARAQNDPPDLILTDLLMPDLGGLDFAHAYCAATINPVPIIVLTAATNVGAAKADPAIRAVMLKPFDIGQLLQTLQTASESVAVTQPGRPHPCRRANG